MARLLLVAAALAMAGGTTAQAAQLAVEDGVVVYKAAPGETNEVAIYPACLPECTSEIPATVNVYTSDLTQIDAGTGCVLSVDVSFIPFFEPAYMCRGVTGGASVDLGDGDDFADLWLGESPVTIGGGAGKDFISAGDGDDTVDGGAGDDELYGSHGKDKVLGGDGNDSLDGDYGGSDGSDAEPGEQREVYEDLEEAGDDTLDGGAGDDRLQGNGGADVLTGGAGFDTVLYSARKAPVSVSLDGRADDGETGERDQASADLEAIATGLGNDTVHDAKGPNTINTGAGDDTIDARDGAVDTIVCGDGADAASLDATDVAGTDCEQRTGAAGTAGGPAGPAPAAAPVAVTPARLVLKLRGRPRRGQRRILLAGELRLPAGADRRLCAGSSVLVKLRAAGHVRRATATLGADCRFSSAVYVHVRRGRLSASATFPGTALIAAAHSRTVRARVRR